MRIPDRNDITRIPAHFLTLLLAAATPASANDAPATWSRSVTWCLISTSALDTGPLDQVVLRFSDDGVVRVVARLDGTPLSGEAVTCVATRARRGDWRPASSAVTVALDAGMVASVTLPPVFEALRAGDHEALRRLVAEPGAVGRRVSMAPIWLEGFDARGGLTALARQEGVTPLHVAVSMRDLVVVRILLAAGADPLQATSDGLTPLGLARRLQADEIEAELRSSAR